MRRFLLAMSLTLSASSLAAATFTVTNTNDSGAGSLRDALTSAQTCSGGPHTIAFDVPVGSLTNGVAVIIPTSPLPSIACAGTTIDGTTQTANEGNTNDVTLGTGGTVGTGPDGVVATGDEPALPQLNGPEVQIQGGGGISPGLAVSADDVTIRGLAIYGFGSGNTSGNIVIGNVANTLIESNVIGAAATSFTSTGVPFGNNITSVSDPGVGSGTTVRQNLIGFSGATGILALGPDALIEDNEIRQNGAGEVEDGIGALVTPFTVQRNLIVGSSGIGIDAGGAGAVTITENTIQGNGFGSSTERSGVFVSSAAGTTISFNVITGNANAGVIPTSNGVRITKNSIHDNGTIGIDLMASPNRSGDGVNANDIGDGDVGANALQNFPIVSTVEHLGPQGGSTRVVGSLNSAASTVYDLEFFANGSCLNHPRDFLEGETFIGSTQVTTDASGVAAFDVTFAVVTPAGTRISATATDPAANTSEFAQRIIFSISPASGPAAGGTPITVSGTNFSDPTMLTFGGVAANVTFVSDQQLTTASPALAPGTVNDVVAQTAANIGVLEKGWVSDFLDVPSSHQFYSFVTTLVSNAITVGVGGSNYGVDQSTLRQQMAVFLLKGKHGLCYTPPPCTGTFGDVACPSTFADWIEALAAEGISGGCGGGNFCPTNAVRRDQMAPFLLKAENGSSYVPPSCTGIFPDVTCPSLFADWIEQLAAEQITGGCGGGNYCPSNPSTRGQMAVFVVKTFGLQ